MATLTVQTIVAAGLDPTYAAASAGGDKVAPGPHTFVHVLNGGASPVTVTVAIPGNLYANIANPDLTVSVPAAGEQMIPVPANPFADPADGLAAITYSGTTSVTVAALRT